MSHLLLSAVADFEASQDDLVLNPKTTRAGGGSLHSFSWKFVRKGQLQLIGKPVTLLKISTFVDVLLMALLLLVLVCLSVASVFALGWMGGALFFVVMLIFFALVIQNIIGTNQIVTFDKGKGTMTQGKRSVPLEEIVAIQVLPIGVPQDSLNSGGHELNLVKIASPVIRETVAVGRNGGDLRQGAQDIADFLSVPLMDGKEGESREDG